MHHYSRVSFFLQNNCKSKLLFPISFLLFLFGIFSSLIFYPVHSQVVRPQVNEKKCWEKINTSNLTAGAVEDEFIWRQKRQSVNGKRVLGITVIRSDEKGFGVIWFDKAGMHFYNEKTNEIKTPINLSNYYYDLIADASLSFFAVKWLNLDGSDGCVALINLNGDIIWQTKLKQKNGCISLMRPSKLGDLLIGISDCGEDDSIFKAEIWDSKKRITKLPGFAMGYKWSLDGKKLDYKWTDKPGLSNKLIKRSGVFDRTGNLFKNNEK